VLYAATDEFHQSFVPGRKPWIWDVVVFDNLGALIALWLMNYFRRVKRPGSIRPLM
jgi:VanZ family protein